MKGSKAFLICFFIISIFIISLISIIIPKKTFSYIENRKLSSIPELNIESIVSKSFMNKYEEYVDDHIIFRDSFVKLSTYSKMFMGQQKINNVLLGLDGYLFEDVQIKENKIFQKNIEDIRVFLENNSNSYIGVIPSSIEILENERPKYYEWSNQLEIINNLYTNIKGKEIDIYSILKEHNSEYIYYKTDHHWTTLGAYYGYTSICNKLGIIPYSLNDFEIELIDDDFKGTIQSKINIDISRDSLYRYNPLFDIKYQRIINEDTNNVLNSLYAYNKLESKEKYAVYLGGNNPIIRLKSNIEEKKKLLMVKDSYSHSLAPFLLNHYSEIVLLDLRYYHSGVQSFIEKENFDDILLLYSIDTFVNDKNLILLNK